MRDMRVLEPDMDDRDEARRRRARALFLMGILLLAASLTTLGFLGYQGSHEELPAGSPHASGSRMLVSAPVRTLASDEVLIIWYDAAPGEPVSAYVVGCRDLAALEQGREPQAPVFVSRGRTDARHVVEPGLFGPREPGCAAHHVVLTWDVAAREPRHAFILDGDAVRGSMARLLGVTALVGAGLSAAGALGRPGFLSPRPVSAPTDDETMGEAFLRLADRVEALLERSRTYHVVAGLLAMAVLYPLAMTFAFVIPRSSEGSSGALEWIMPLAMGVLLAVLTGLWARRLREMGAELRAWRHRISHLRALEARLLAEE